MYMHKEGISLRKLHKGDLHSLLELKNESWWGTHGTPILNPEDQLLWYESLGHTKLAMVAERVAKSKADGPVQSFLGSKVVKTNSERPVPIGVALYTDIDWFARSLHLSGSIYKDKREGGTVQAAFSCGLDFCFEVLNMFRVSAEVLETHIAAQKLEVEHLGFKVEGRRRKAVYKAGRYYDSIVLGILREDWEQTDRVRRHLSSESKCCNENFDHTLAQKYAGLAKERLGL